jgi:hypothetical protein
MPYRSLFLKAFFACIALRATSAILAQQLALNETPTQPIASEDVLPFTSIPLMSRSF